MGGAPFGEEHSLRLPTRAPLMRPNAAARGFERQDLPRSGSAHGILIVTRENVPGRPVYFLHSVEVRGFEPLTS